MAPASLTAGWSRGGESAAASLPVSAGSVSSAQHLLGPTQHATQLTTVKSRRVDDDSDSLCCAPSTDMHIPGRRSLHIITGREGP
eukprot:3436994-Rhodomonas_salina.4